MKIRTDFVTNSSSSSFVAIKVKTKDRTYTEELESGNVPIVPGDGGCLNITEEDLQSASDIKQILWKVCSWFYGTLEDPLCWEEVEPSWCVDEEDIDEDDDEEDIDEGDYEEKPSLNWEDCKQILKFYGNCKNMDLQTVKMSDIKNISLFSRMEYYDEPYGARFLTYDYSTKTLNEENREIDSFEEDSYGERLYERFLSEPDTK